MCLLCRQGRSRGTGYPQNPRQEPTALAAPSSLIARASVLDASQVHLVFAPILPVHFIFRKRALGQTFYFEMHTLGLMRLLGTGSDVVSALLTEGFHRAAPETREPGRAQGLQGAAGAVLLCQLTPSFPGDERRKKNPSLLMQEWVFPCKLLRGELCRALSWGILQLGASSSCCQGRLQHPWVLQASKASTQQVQALLGLCRFSLQPSKSPLQELEVLKQKGLCWERPPKERSTQEAAGSELSDTAQSRDSKRAVTPPASSLPCSALLVPLCSPRAPSHDAGSQPTERGRVGVISPTLTPPAQ